MPDLPRSHLIAYALAVVAILAVGWRQVAHSGAAEPAGAPIEAGASADGGGPGSGDGAAAGPSGDGGRLVVHVAGWVRRPGVYRLAAGRRVDDALAAAGGARRGADLSQLNLAMKLEDGRQILVTRGGDCPAGPAGCAAPGAPPPASAGSGAAAGAGAASGTAALGATGALVNLNQATLEQLDTLQGVGPITAANIVAYRDEHGGFGSVDELGEIAGIGPVRLESLRGQVTL